MTVLGKLPAAPKPINLPSQRLENRGLDPNVQIVPRGSVSWGPAGRSPPTSSSLLGNSIQSSSPPVSGPWGGAPPRPTTPGNTGPSSGSSGGSWVGNAPRPSSAGSGTRPSSAGSFRQTQEVAGVINNWGPASTRPSSASGVLEQAQPQASVIRPRSAETRTLSGQAPTLTRFAEQINGQTVSPPPAAWGGAGAVRKLSEEPHQPSRFTLTRVDFPTLGSEKNPDLRPQQNRSGSSPSERMISVDEYVSPYEEQPPPGPTGPQEDLSSTLTSPYGTQERMQESWRREPRPHGGNLGMQEGGWHKDGPLPLQTFGAGQTPLADTWRRDLGHGGGPGGGPSDDNWRRGGPPLPYGPPGPARFPPEPTGYVNQQRYVPGPGPGPYGRGGAPGLGGYGHHGDMYGSAAPFGRQGGGPPRPGPPMGPGIYSGPFDNYYGSAAPGFGSLDEREMMMLGMSGPPGMYGNFPQVPLGEPFGRYPHGSPGPGPRHMLNNAGMNRERNDSLGYDSEGFREGVKYKGNSTFKDGGGFKSNIIPGFSKENSRPTSHQDPGEIHRLGKGTNNGLTSEMQRPSLRAGHHGPHRDWGAVASSDEPMDFSKPVFEEDVSSASPTCSSEQGPPLSSVNVDIIQVNFPSKSADQLKIHESTEDVSLLGDKVRQFVDSQAAVGIDPTHPPEGDTKWKQNEGDRASTLAKSRVEDAGLKDSKDQFPGMANPFEGSELSDKTRGNGSRMLVQSPREMNLGRESVFSPNGGRGLGNKKETSSATSSVTTPMVVNTSAAGKLGSSNSNKIAVSVSQGPLTSSIAHTSLSDGDVSPSVHERHTNVNPTSPSGSDGQKGSDKLRILKRVGDVGPDSPQGKSVNTSEASHVETHGFALPGSELVSKDDARARGKSGNSQDGEKEWRPKVSLVADTQVESSRWLSTAGPKTLSNPTISSGPVGGITVSSDKASLSSGSPGNAADSYDYEAQRARMKEIAAQRAIELRKEEEERIKEQKAKALAKLEELNRRSLIVPVSQVFEEPALDEVSEEGFSVSVQSENPKISLKVLVDEVQVTETSSGTGVMTARGGVRNGRNEHGKRERVDRKGSGRSREDHRVKISSGEHCEMVERRPSAASSQMKLESSVMPPLSQQSPPHRAVLASHCVIHGSMVAQEESSSSVLSQASSAAGSLVDDHLTPKFEVRHQAKQYATQPKQVARQFQGSLDVEHPAAAQDTQTADNTGEWNAISNSIQGLDSKEVSSASNVVSDVVIARKRKMKNSGRHKQKPDGLFISTDSASSAEPNQVWNSDLSSSNDLGMETGKPLLQTVVRSEGENNLNAVPLLVVQKQLGPQELVPESATVEQTAAIESAGSDGGSFRSVGDLPIKRTQRKPQPARRASARERAISQDVRVGDKPHVGEGMIWAPVRSPPGSHPTPLKGGYGADGGPTSATPGDRKEEVVVTQQTGRARRAELERYTPKPVVKQQVQQQEETPHQQAVSSGSEMSSVSVFGEVQPNLATSENKSGSDTWQGDGNTKQKYSHASWRQRAPGSERSNTTKESQIQNRPIDATQVQHVELAESGGKVLQPSHNNQTSQQNYQRNRGQPNASENSRTAISQQSKTDVGHVGRHQASSLVTEKERKQPEVTQQGSSLQSNMPAPSSMSIEKEKAIVQEGVTPYQPPRPGSSQRNRGLESEVHSSHEHARLHRANIAQGDRQQPGGPGKFDREHNSHERPMNNQQSKPQSFRRQGPGSTHEGTVAPREKDQHQSPAVGSGQVKPISQIVADQVVAPVLTEKEQNHPELVSTHLPRSSAMQRPRQLGHSHEKEQTTVGSHTQQQPRFRQPGHDREHQRDVSNAVHHQHHRGVSDGHWKQTGAIIPSEGPSSEYGQAAEHPTRAVSNKSQATLNTTVDQDHHTGSRPGSHQQSRADPQNKPHGPVAADSLKQSQSQVLSQPQKVQQQAGCNNANPKSDYANNGAHWNGESKGSPPLRGRDHGHSRRGRFGGRFGGTSRGGEIENRRDHLPKQRLSINATGGAVPSQVGG